MFPARKLLAAVLLVTGLVLVNYLASSLPLRYDATAESIYSLSPGTRSLLGKIEEPVTLDLYFSKDATGLPIAYKNYAERVREMLRQYVRAGRGKLTLNVINPQPDSPEEEKAAASGLAAQVAPQGGEKFYFGLVVTQADQSKVIEAFTPQREQFLEYDLSRALAGVQQLDKRKLGLLTSLPLQGTNPRELQMMMMMGRQPEQPQFIVDEWRQSYDLVTVEPGATELPADLDVLAVIHPQNLSPRLQFAIDQFLLSGKPVLLAVDPSSQHFKRSAGRQAMFGGPTPGVSSDLPLLLRAYGVAYDAGKVVGDQENAMDLRTPDGGTERDPTWIGLTRANFNAKSLPTAQLTSTLFVESGSLAPVAGTGLDFQPLIETSAQSGEVAAAMLQFGQADEISRQLTTSGKKTIAALVTGKFKSAFPEGAPKDEPKPDPAKPAEPKPEPKPAAPALKESKGKSTLVVFADTDWLLDDFSVRKMNLFGHVAAEPLNDNLALGANVVDYLGGSPDLLSIRGKGNSLHPFVVVKQMEVEARQKYQEKLTSLEAQLQQVQSRLGELQGKKTEGNRLVASPEVAKAIEDFQKQSAKLRGERREIRRALRVEIDALENRLLILNLVLSPALVLAFGLWFHRRRRTARPAAA